MRASRLWRAVAFLAVLCLGAVSVPLRAQGAIPPGQGFAAAAVAGKMSIGSGQVTEGNSLTSSMAFIVSTSSKSSSPMSATYTTVNGTAIAPGDYTAKTGTVTIPANSTNVTIVISIVGDTLDENTEAFTVRLTNPVNATIVNGTGTGTITDNDNPPVVSVGAASATEPNTGATTPMVFTVTNSAVSGLPVTVSYQTVNGTATSPADYTAKSGTVTIPAGSSSATVSVTIIGDVIYEGNDTLTLRISSPVNATLGTTNGAGTIVENDARPTITVGNGSATEGNAGTTTMTFTVTSSFASGVAATVNFATANGSASSPADYTAKSGTVTIPAGSTSATFSVLVAGDLLAEGNETFTVALSNAVNATLGTSSVTGTIVDDDAPPAVSIAPASITEGNTGTTAMTFTVSIPNSTTSAVSVNYATSPGTATAPADFTAKSGTVTIPAGSTSATFTVLIVGDTLYEANETFTVTLSNPVNATLGTGSATGTINNQDAPPAVSVAPASANEGVTTTSPMVFTITLSVVSGLPVTVSFATSDGTAHAPDDYMATTGSVTIPAGSTSTTFSVLVVGDTLDENNEAFSFALSDPVNATLGTATASGTITDNDPPPVVSISDSSLTEGNSSTSPMQFTVSLSTASGLPVTATYTTTNGSAKAPGDYTTTTGTVTIPALSTSAIVTVPIVGDAIYEGNEAFTVTLSSPTNATLGTAAATGTIVDNDTAPVVSIADSSVAEGSSGTRPMVFTVTLSAASGLATSVNYQTSNGSAVAPGDYTAGNGTVTVPAGSTTATFSVLVAGDTLYEGDETFTVTLSAPVNASLGTATATGRIDDDEVAPVLSVANVAVSEGASGTAAMVFSVTASKVAGVAMSVDYATANGTASAPGDYTATSGTVTIPAGSTSATFTVLARGDSLYEANETLTVTLSSPVNATIGSGTATGTINNDDTAPSVSVSDLSVSEGDGATTPATFTVSVSAVSGLPATVNYATSNGSASAPGDYTAKTGSVTIPAGSTSATFSVNVAGDSLYEADETFTVTLSGPVNATLGTASATGTIENDDAPPAVSVDDAFRTEGDTGTVAMVFTVTIDAVSGLPVTVSYATDDDSATAPADYQAKTGSVTIPAGQTSATFSVLVVGDHLHEGVESFDVALSSPVNAVLGDAAATGTITDDDAAGVSIDDLSVNEGDAGPTPAVFHVSLSSPSVDPVTVDYATDDGTATAPSDYTTKTGSVTIPAGDTEATFTVSIVGNTLHEHDETFTVTLSNPPAGVNIARAVATATIVDDDAAPAVSIDDVSVTEGDTGTTAAEFPVSLSGASGTATTVSYATTEGSATPPGDYHTKTGTLTIPAGDTSASITVDVVGNTLHEHDKTFTVVLSDPTDATLGDGTAAGTILDDDAVPVVSIADISVQEHDSATTAATFTVTASVVSGTPTTVTYATSEGSAEAPGDYVTKTGTVTIAAGQTTATFTVAVVGDTLFEPDETFTVTLSNPVDATLGDDEATATIVDDDTAPTVSIAGTSVPNGASGMTAPADFVVTLSAASGLPVTVQYATADGTATAPDNYAASSGTLTIPAGESTGTISVTTNGGMPHEGNRTFTVTISNPSGATLGAPTTATASMVDEHRLGLATGAIFWTKSPAEQESELVDLESMGAQWLRTTLFWRDVQPTNSTTFDWSEPDFIVARANAHHISIIWQVIGAPFWAVPGSSPGVIADYSPDPSLYATFVAQAATRYIPQGVRTYELGNSPNLKNNGNTPNVPFYKSLLCQTYAAVKAVSTDTTVLTGGLGGIRSGNGNITGANFVVLLYANGAQGCFDAISYHPYTFPQLAPDDGTEDWTAMLNVRQTMVTNGDGNKKIWATEYGAPTNGPNPENNVTEAVQAQTLDVGYRLFSTYSWSGPMCWFRYEDKGTDTSQQGNFFGLVRFDGSHKPAYDMFVTDAHLAIP